MSIQEEIHKAMQELQKKSNKGQRLEENDLSLLLLTSLIEEEGNNVER